MERSQYQVVVFDLGEVLATPLNLISTLAAMIDTEPSAFAAAYWEHRDTYDRGISAADYWSRVGDSLGITIPDDACETLTKLDTEQWTSIRDDAHDVLQQLNAESVRVAILSNAPRHFEAAIADRKWATTVEQVFVSGVLGFAKPDQQIYDFVTGALNVAATSVLFFDDRQENVRAANAAGWEAVLWTSPQQMRNELIARGLIIEPDEQG